MGKLLGPEFLAGLDKNPEYTRAGVDRLYCTSISRIVSLSGHACNVITIALHVSTLLFKSFMIQLYFQSLSFYRSIFQCLHFLEEPCFIELPTSLVG